MEYGNGDIMKTIKKITNATIIGLSLFISIEANADTIINPTQVGNISVSGYSYGNSFLTVNWGNGDQNIGLVQFDVSAFLGKTVSGAIINLYQWANSGNGAVFDLYENTSAWSPSINSWASAPSHLSTPFAQLVIGDGNTKVWRSVDVTSIVNDWTAGGHANYGFTLERVDQSNPAIYFSAATGSYGGSAIYAPTLDVNSVNGNVAPPVPEPETFVLLIAGLGLVGVMSRKRKISA